MFVPPFEAMETENDVGLTVTTALPPDPRTNVTWAVKVPRIDCPLVALTVTVPVYVPETLLSTVGSTVIWTGTWPIAATFWLVGVADSQGCPVVVVVEEFSTIADEEVFVMNQEVNCGPPPRALVKLKLDLSDVIGPLVVVPVL